MLVLLLAGSLREYHRYNPIHLSVGIFEDKSKKAVLVEYTLYRSSKAWVRDNHFYINSFVNSPVNEIV